MLLEPLLVELYHTTYGVFLETLMILVQINDANYDLAVNLC